MTENSLSTTNLADRKLPPIAHLIVLSMACVIASGIYLGSHLPQRASLGPVTVLLVLATLSLIGAIITVSRIEDFNWKVFFQVWRWTLLTYVVISGLLEFVFIFDHTRGSMLIVMTLSLIIFALDIPVLLSFSVARYQEKSVLR
ncbi:MAG TPA: hypothetical protein VMU99_08820 [Acidimicrobiales bacterium]|nr:hypothetical protein [Acidimicrobiales bacterium]